MSRDDTTQHRAVVKTRSQQIVGFQLVRVAKDPALRVALCQAVATPKDGQWTKRLGSSSQTHDSIAVSTKTQVHSASHALLPVVDLASQIVDLTLGVKQCGPFSDRLEFRSRELYLPHQRQSQTLRGTEQLQAEFVLSWNDSFTRFRWC